MVDRPVFPLTLSSLAALLALGLAIAGILFPDLYKPMTPDRLMPGTMSQDTISAAVALALFALVRPLAHQGGARLWCIWLGLNGYTAYAFGLYAFETVINPLFLGYIATFGLSVWAIVTFFSRADLGQLSATTPPRRLTAGLFVLLTAMFVFLWLSILIPAIQSRTPPEGATIFVFDLALVLPALTACAAMLWRGWHWGDVLALPLLIKAATVGLSVLIGTLLAPAWGLETVPSEVATYAVLTVLPAALMWPWWRALAP